MAELADALALGASGATHGGSSPSLPTTCGRHARPSQSSTGKLALGANGVTPARLAGGHGGSPKRIPLVRLEV